MSTPSEQVEFQNIAECFKYCRTAYHKAGYDLRFPKNTDPRNTYMWRNIKSFCWYASQENISDYHLPRLIDAMVYLAAESKRLDLGLRILISKPLINKAIEHVHQDDIQGESVIYRIAANHRFLLQFEDRQGALASSRVKRGFPNIIMWYKTNKLSMIYMAISRSCMTTINRLDECERAILPTRVELITCRHRLLDTAKLRAKARAILKSDWIE